jgi:outer membrane protein assembly factor BamA
VYGGYETSEGPILGLEFRNVNFLRRGDSLRLNAEQSGAGWNAAAQWTNPAFLGRANSLDAQLFGFARERPGYHEQTFGLRTSLNRRPNPHLTLGVFSTLSTHAVDTVGLAPAELGPTHYRLVSVGGLVTLDHRNSPVSPTRGWFASGLLESGLGAGAGSVAYLKTDLGAAWYHTFSPRWRVAVGARWGLIQSRDGVDGLPADLRFYNGGANTVRSFAFQHLGPVNAAGVPLGGLGYDVISAELSRTLVENLELAVFGDAGSLSREGGVLQILPGDPRYALGLGLRYRLPVGPIRVDYGFNPARRAGESVGALHITFGFAF